MSHCASLSALTLPALLPAASALVSSGHASEAADGVAVHGLHGPMEVSVCRGVYLFLRTSFSTSTCNPRHFFIPIHSCFTVRGTHNELQPSTSDRSLNTRILFSPAQDVQASNALAAALAPAALAQLQAQAVAVPKTVRFTGCDRLPLGVVMKLRVLKQAAVQAQQTV